MIRVDSHDTYGTVGFFDPEIGRLQEVERNEVDLRRMALSGHFAYLGETVAVFYRFGGDLLIWLSGRVWSAAPSLVTWSKEGSESRLMVQNDGGAQVHIRYQVEVRDPDDITPFVDDEDWDFGLYITNVLNDPARRARIYR